MKEIKGSVMIMVPADKVWAKMMDFSSYPKWNPWITGMRGEMGVGSLCEMTVQQPGKGVTDLKATVARIEEGKEILLKSKLRGGLVKEEHVLSVEPIDAGRSIFFQSMRFSGPMAGLIGGTIKASQKGLGDMNAALKKLCEEGG